MKKVNILDVSLRDGSYAIDFSFTAEDTEKICRALEDAGFEYIEIGHGVGLNASNSGLGKAAASDREYLEAAKRTLTKAKFGMFCIPGVAKLDHIDLAAEYGMQFVRIGTDVDAIDSAREFISRAKKYGMFVASNVMKSYALDTEEFAKKALQVENYGADLVYLVDSAGGMLPEDIERYYNSIRKVTNISLGFHGHDNLGMAIANSLKAAELGFEFVDSSLQGMGRSAGNAATELLVAALAKKGFSTDVDFLKTLDTGEKFIQPLVELRGKVPLDVVSGYAEFHSSFMHHVASLSKKYSINPAALIMELCQVNKVSVDPEIAENIASVLKKEKSINLEKYGFKSYVGKEQDFAQLNFRNELKSIFDNNWNSTFIFDSILEKEITYQEFFSKSLEFGEFLNDQGLEKGDRLVAILENSTDLLCLYFACLLKNICVIPIDPTSGEQAINEILKDVEYSLLISIDSEHLSYNNAIDAKVLSKISSSQNLVKKDSLEELDKIDPQKTYLITHTSGSSGKPKGVMHSFYNLALSAKRFSENFELNSNNTFYHNLPMTYMAGILNLFYLPLLNSSRLVIAKRFNVSEIMNFWEKIIQFKANTFWFVPTTISMLLKIDRSNSGKDYCKNNEITAFVGTAPLRTQAREEFEERYSTKLYESYGLSETLFVSTNSPSFSYNDGVGKILNDATVTIRQDSEITISVPWMFKGYLNQPIKDAYIDNTFLSGDLGSVSEQGRLLVTGRKKDLIIRGGINISPRKLEELLHATNYFSELVIAGIDDDILGEKITCFYVKNELDFSKNQQKEVNDLVLEKLGESYKVDEFVEVEEIAKNKNGKVDKNKIIRGYVGDS